MMSSEASHDTCDHLAAAPQPHGLRCAAAGQPSGDDPLEGYHRVYVDDPFGNRIELMEPHT